MFFLDVRALDGSVTQRPLADDAHLSVGRHSTNDIQIDEPDVGTMHCRIGWNRSGFEVVAAAADGVEVNGSLVRKATLKSGDLIRVGSLDLIFRDSSVPPSAAEVPQDLDDNTPSNHIDSGNIPLKMDDDEPEPAYRLKPPPAAEPATAPSPKPSTPSSPPVRDYDFSEGELELLEEEQPASVPTLSRMGSDPKPIRSTPSAPPPRSGTVENAFRPRRPSEIDPLKSPLVLGLTGGAVALVVTALTLWFVIGRQSAERDYQAAVAAMEQRKFATAVELFSAFLEKYPNNNYASAARNAVDICSVERWISGSTPNWAKGLEALGLLSRASAARPDETALRTSAHRFAEEISLGAANSAGRVRDRSLLDVSREATRYLQLTAPDRKPPEAALEKIVKAVELAEAALRRDETFTAGLAEIDAALKLNQPLVALAARRRLLDRYANVQSDQELISRAQKTLEMEQTAVVSNSPSNAPLTEDRTKPALPSITLARQTMARSDLVPGDTQTVTVSADCCFAVDRLTGTPIWQRVIGLDTPFPPKTVSTNVLAVLVFDTRFGELLLLRQKTGELIWRLPLEDVPAGGPLEYAGHLFVTTAGGWLYQIETETGIVHASLKFSQPLATPPVLLADGEHLVAVGSQGVLYVLTHRPLACKQVVLTDHAPGAISAPPLPLAEFVLLAENDRLDASKLTLWSTGTTDPAWSPIASVRLEGQVLDPVAVRGKQLIVPTRLSAAVEAAEPATRRISILTVADRMDDLALTLLTSQKYPEPGQGPLFVATGPNDEWWMVRSALRRFKLTGKTIKTLPGEFPVGISRQPVQFLDEDCLLTAAWPYSSADFFFAVNREEMAGLWQVVLGSPTHAMVPVGADSCMTVSETGDVHLFSLSRFAGGGFLSKPVSQCTLPKDLQKPLRATELGNKLIAVDCAGQTPQLWIVNPDSLGEKSIALPAPIEAAPVKLGDALLLPLPGRIRLIDPATGKRLAEDILAPIGEGATSVWLALYPLDDNQFVAITQEGTLSRIQHRLEPTPHLFEVARVSLSQRLSLAPVHFGESLLAATSMELQWLTPGNLEIQARTPVPGERTQASRAARMLYSADEDGFFLTTAQHKLFRYPAEMAVDPAWEFSAVTGPLSGPPLRVGENWLLTAQKGRIYLVSHEDGTLLNELSLEQPIAFGPRRIGDTVVVGTLDGSLHSLKDWLKSEATP